MYRKELWCGCIECVFAGEGLIEKLNPKCPVGHQIFLILDKFRHPAFQGRIKPKRGENSKAQERQRQ